MTLDEYIKLPGVTGAALAERIGISAASLTRIRQGRQGLSLDLARRIVSATGGKVSLEELPSKEAA